MSDAIEKPNHYNSHPSGVECVEIAQEFDYNVGTAVAYLWRYKGKNGIEDLKKARKHIEFEITRLENLAKRNAAAKGSKK